jgi:putative endopeptidase
VKIAYPDKWKDYTQLKVESPKQGATLYSNLQNVSAWQYQRNLDKVGKPVDKTEWGMSPQTVNAYYSGSNNEIVFPAAILQPPFYNPKADAAVNFGGIGAVIGHEISHGFDDSGSRFDGDGNLNNWWTDADRKNFDAKVGQLAAQYSAYEPVKGSFVNGKFTSGENIGDLGGVAVAYDALQMYLKDKGNPGNQRIYSGSEILYELGNSLENESNRSVYDQSGENRSAFSGNFQSIRSVGESGFIYQSI